LNRTAAFIFATPTAAERSAISMPLAKDAGAVADEPSYG
jgi:hypothetical protein